MTNAFVKIQSLPLLLLFPLIQACSPVGAGTTQAVSLGYSGAPSGLMNSGEWASVGGGGLNATPVVASAPEAIKPKATATVSASGGIEPYTYKLAAGKGTLNNNVYTAPADSEVAAVIVVDKIGQIASVTIMVTPTGTVPVAATPLPQVPASTFAQTSMPNGAIKTRACDLNGLAQYGYYNGDEGMLTAAIHYQHCLVLGRGATPVEWNIWYKNIPKKTVDANQMPIILFNSQEFRDRYGSLSMPPQDFIVFVSRLLVNRDPTNDELTQLAGAFQVGGQEGVFKAIMASPTYNQVHPFMNLVKAKLAQM
jgi:hypothetical protein